MTRARTFAEKVLGAAAGHDVRAGEIVVCEPSLVLGTDGSTPMALEYFAAMGGRRVAHPERVLLSRDHYAPPDRSSTRGFHDRMDAFARMHGIEILEVGAGIGFLVALEAGRIRPGTLVAGADSHTVTCGAAGALAVGIGSSDLAGALLTGRVWLRVPETARIVVDGDMPTGVVAKDLALELVRALSGRLGPFTALEFAGSAIAAMSTRERSVLANLAAEMGAMASPFVVPGPGPSLVTDPGAAVTDVLRLDVSSIAPRVARAHAPANVAPVTEVLGEAVDWVLLGTCTAGHAEDFREALRVLDASGGVAPGVTLAVVPPTAAVREELERDGTLARLQRHGAILGTTGCGPCCGTSGPLPPPGARVISTANRNFRARMGDPSISIMLASPATCAAAAAHARVVDPRDVA